MKLKFFCVHDSKVGAYMSPFVLRSTGEAIRSFESAVNDVSTQFNKYPADFHLFEIGEFDEQQGVLLPAKHPVSLGCALEFLKQQTIDGPIMLGKAHGPSSVKEAK